MLSKRKASQGSKKPEKKRKVTGSSNTLQTPEIRRVAHAEIDKLPKEIIVYLLQFMGRSDFKRIFLVSKKWYAVFEEPSFWRTYSGIYDENSKFVEEWKRVTLIQNNHYQIFDDFVQKHKSLQSFNLEYLDIEIYDLRGTFGKIDFGVLSSFPRLKILRIVLKGPINVCFSKKTHLFDSPIETMSLNFDCQNEIQSPVCLFPNLKKLALTTKSKRTVECVTSMTPLKIEKLHARLPLNLILLLLGKIQSQKIKYKCIPYSFSRDDNGIPVAHLDGVISNVVKRNYTSRLIFKSEFQAEPKWREFCSGYQNVEEKILALSYNSSDTLSLDNNYSNYFNALYLETKVQARTICNFTRLCINYKLNSQEFSEIASTNPLLVDLKLALYACKTSQIVKELSKLKILKKLSIECRSNFIDILNSGVLNKIETLEFKCSKPNNNPDSSRISFINESNDYHMKCKSIKLLNTKVPLEIFDKIMPHLRNVKFEILDHNNFANVVHFMFEMQKLEKLELITDLPKKLNVPFAKDHRLILKKNLQMKEFVMNNEVMYHPYLACIYTAGRLSSLEGQESFKFEKCMNNCVESVTSLKSSSVFHLFSDMSVLFVRYYILSMLEGRQEEASKNSFLFKQFASSFFDKKE